MQNIHGNNFQCKTGETVKMRFKSTDDGILRVLFRERILFK